MGVRTLVGERCGGTPVRFRDCPRNRDRKSYAFRCGMVADSYRTRKRETPRKSGTSIVRRGKEPFRVWAEMGVR
jgi:hypothetical protein